MKNKQRVAVSSMSLMLASAMALAGCSGSGQNEPTATGAGASAQPTATVAPEAELKPVKLVWYMRSSEPKNAESVLKKANEIIQDKIKATVDFKFINPGDYNNKMQLIMSSGEEYDLAFTANWANNYVANVGKGAYIPIDDLLAKHPNLQSLFKKEIWDAVRVGGKIYGVPNNQIMADQPGMWFKKDLVEKHGIDLSKVKTMSDLTPIYQTIKDKEPGVTPIRGGITWLPYAPEIEGFHVDTQTWKVYHRAGQTTDHYALMREWYTKGFFPQDVATLKDEASLIKAGKIFSRYNRQKPGSEAEFKQANGFDIVNIATGQAVINKTAVLSTLNAISITSKNPDRAMMLLDLVNTDKDLFNLLKYGLEGQDYTKAGPNRIEKKPDTYSLPGWTFGNEFNGYVVQGQDDNVWEDTKKLNDTAIIDPMISFSFDRLSVESELAQLGAVDKEFTAILNNGLDDPEKTLKAWLEKRKTAGHDKVMAEIQRQVDEWRKTQGK